MLFGLLLIAFGVGLFLVPRSLDLARFFPRPDLQPAMLADMYCRSAVPTMTKCREARKGEWPQLLGWAELPIVVLHPVARGVSPEVRARLEPILRAHLDAAGFDTVAISTESPDREFGVIQIRFPERDGLRPERPGELRRLRVGFNPEEMRWGRPLGKLGWVTVDIHADAVLNRAREEARDAP